MRRGLLWVVFVASFGCDGSGNDDAEPVGCSDDLQCACPDGSEGRVECDAMGRVVCRCEDASELVDGALITDAGPDGSDPDAGPNDSGSAPDGLSADASVETQDAAADVTSPADVGPPQPDAALPDAAPPAPDAAPPPALECPRGEPEFARVERVNRTIVIDEPGVYDYENVLHEWSGGGRCNQQENQPYILRIAASNVTLRNFAYRGAPDGIHIGTSSDGQGHSAGRSIQNIRLENVTGWACEDALTTQFGVEDVTIVGSRFYPNPDSDERDKLLQLNFGDVSIERSSFDGGDAGVCVMFKGGQEIRIVDSCFKDCDRAVNGSTQNGIVGRISSEPSQVYAARNEGRFPNRALIFWDPWRFLTADGNVHCIAEDNVLHDGGIDDMREGATIEYP